MEVLIIVRDVILAVLLSWIGVDYTESKTEEAQPNVRLNMQISERSSEQEFLVLKASHVESNSLCREEWFRS
ncbi:hypothetical protein [Ponticaulis profundi]|uniref:Uncharacterized protein n=1 Tax=Ponticaulis profundi TaxID=2665222 RepID=A0ABW1S6C4_9PROT